MGLFLALSCSLDYTTGLTSAVEGSVPTLLFVDIKQSSVKQGAKIFSLEAKKAELYESLKTTRLFDFSFMEYDKSGEFVTKGSAAWAEYNTETQNAQITGKIQIQSLREKAKLLAENLVWINENKQLKSEPDQRVTIEKENSVISGEGFVVNFKTNTLEFTKTVEGSHIFKDEE